MDDAVTITLTIDRRLLDRWRRQIAFFDEMQGTISGIPPIALERAIVRAIDEGRAEIALSVPQEPAA